MPPSSSSASASSSSDGESTSPTPARTPSKWRQLVAGAGAGIITKTSVAPLERMKVLFQVQGMHAGQDGAKTFSSAPDAVKAIFREEGIRGFYRGNAANVIRVIPVYALKFPGNDFFKQLFAERDPRTGAAITDHRMSSSRKLAAGSCAGLLQIVTTYPLDLMRTRMALADASPRGQKYTSIAHCGQLIYRTEGVASFYKGLSPTLLCGVPYVGMQMTFYSNFKLMYERQFNINTAAGESIPLYGMLTCGSAAGLVAQTISFPFDVVRHRMQANGLNGAAKLYANTFDCFRQMTLKEGVGAFYRGWTVNACRCLPGAAIQFTAYDVLKSLLHAD